MKLSDSWIKAKELYISGKQTEAGIVFPTLAEIGELVGLKPQTIRLRSSKENWPEQKKLFVAKTQTLRTEQKSEVMATESVQFDSDCLKLARAGLNLIARDMKAELLLTPVDKLSRSLKDFQSVGRLAFGEITEKTENTEKEIIVVDEETKELLEEVRNGIKPHEDNKDIQG